MMLYVVNWRDLRLFIRDCTIDLGVLAPSLCVHAVSLLLSTPLLYSLFVIDSGASRQSAMASRCLFGVEAAAGVGEGVVACSYTFRCMRQLPGYAGQGLPMFSCWTQLARLVNVRNATPGLAFPFHCT